jgi:hypothetical protein
LVWPSAASVAGVGASIDAVQRGTQVDQRADVLELGGGIREQVDRLPERMDCSLAVNGPGECAQAGTARPRKVDPFGEREVLLGQSTGGAELALSDEHLAEVRIHERISGPIGLGRIV